MKHTNIESQISKYVALAAEYKSVCARKVELENLFSRSIGVRNTVATKAKKHKVAGSRAKRGSVSGSVIRILSEAGQPLHKDELAKRVLSSDTAFGKRMTQNAIVNSAYQLSRRAKETGVSVSKSNFSYTAPAVAPLAT